MSKRKELFLWFLVSLPIAPIIIFGHELFHYIPALFLTQLPVDLHWASIRVEEALTGYRQAIVSILGPVYSWSLVLLAFVIIKRKLPSAWLGLFLGLGLFGSARSLRQLILLVKALLGHEVLHATRGQASDETSFAFALNIPWQIPTAFSFSVAIFGLIYFTIKAFQLRSWAHVLVLFLGYIVSGILYMLYGPILFPGGLGLRLL